MTPSEIKEEVARHPVRTIAPDEDLSQLKDDVRFREQMELDSMDFLGPSSWSFAKRHRIQIPEGRTTVELASMDSTVKYLEPLLKDVQKGVSPKWAEGSRQNRPTALFFTAHRPTAYFPPPCTTPSSSAPGMSGLAAGIRLGLLRSAGVHSGAAHHGSAAHQFVLPLAGGADYDVGLHAPDQFHAQGRESAGRSLALLRQLRLSWDDFLHLAAAWFRDCFFPAGGLRFTNDLEVLREEVAPRVFPRQRAQFRPPRRRGSSSTTDLNDQHAAIFRPAQRLGEILRETAARRNALVPAHVSTDQPASTTWTGPSSRSCFRSIFMEGPWPAARWGAAHPQAARPPVFARLGGASFEAEGWRRSPRNQRRYRQPRRPRQAAKRSRPRRRPSSSAGWCENDANVRRRARRRRAALSRAD